MTDSAKPGDRPIDKRIMEIYDELTASERRLAAVVLEAQANLSSFTAGELAARADISNATAARFFKRLGYANYGDARRHARQTRDWGSPLTEWADFAASENGTDDFGRFVAEDIQNLTRTAELIGAEDLRLAVKILAEARSVRVLGFRNSMALAGYARGLLVHLRPNVQLLPLPGMSLGEDMAGIGPEDALLVVGFRRRPPLLLQAMEAARAAGASTVLIADLTAARTARAATVTLRCHNRGTSLFDSYVAPMSLINYLGAAVSRRLGEAAERRLADIEEMHERLSAPVTPQPRS